MYNIKIIIWKLLSISIFFKLFLYCFKKKKKSFYQSGPKYLTISFQFEQKGWSVEINFSPYLAMT